jgi:hypothetical protein
MARNSYGGNCYRCGLWVAPGTGYFEKRQGQRGFRVQHCYRTHNGGVTCEMAKKNPPICASSRGGAGVLERKVSDSETAVKETDHAE